MLAVSFAPSGMMRVLLIDDDPAAILLVELALQEADMDVDFTSEGSVQAARARLAAGCEHGGLPDIVLLDLNLPDGSGHDLLIAMKQNPALRRIPVVILSTSSYEPDIERATYNGAAAYYVKPSGFIELVALMRELPRHLAN